MIEMNCPNCGHLLRIDERYAGCRGTCRACKGPIEVPAIQPGETAEGNVSPESFGAYGKAADARWQDPSEQVNWKAEDVDIPEEVLAKHRQLKRKRRNIITLASAAGVLLLALILIPVLGFRGSSSSKAEQSTPAVPAPAVAPLEASTPSVPAIPPPNVPKRLPSAPRQAVEATASLEKARVFAVASDPHYHLGECEKYRDGTGERFQGSVAEAVGVGYIPCPLCKPPSPGNATRPSSEYAPAPPVSPNR